MHNCFLLLGGNQGNRLEMLKHAELAIIEKVGEIVQASSMYETEAWGFRSEQMFYNKVLQVETALIARQVLRTILAIENELGRVRNSKIYVSRIIDIDMLFFDDEIINEPKLQVPHPKLHQRMFTLLPLMEICPHKFHPSLKLTIAQLLDQCDDKLIVRKLNPNLNLYSGN